MLSVNEVKNPYLGVSGLDSDLSAEEREFQARVRRFALDVMRPTSAQLDKMTAQELIDPSSPLWKYLQSFEELGIAPSVLIQLGPERLKRILPIVFEELGYGDAGLAVAAFISKRAEFAVRANGDPELIKEFGHLRGCWIATYPDRGSDVIDYSGFELAAGSTQSVATLQAKVSSSEIVLTGRSSEWIACAPIAECALIHCPADYGDGPLRPDGGVFGAVLVVPLDLPGVSRGTPSEMIGQRCLPIGSIKFDDVRLPTKYLLHGKEEYHASMFGVLTAAVMSIGAIATGVATAAFERALEYSRERRQGGVPLVRHQLVRWRLYEMWRKVEVSRAMLRRAAAFNFSAEGPHLLASITAKTTAIEAATDVALEAIRIFGANGVGRQYPVEKLLRDIQGCTIQSGEDHTLGLQAANWLLRGYQPSGHGSGDGARA
ncbi:acyl-CoA dehydrogenase family protein [Bradyrhizobium lablabi]|uniref:acyl-CoA dehydrogenase family protein n=1 Tax=Bradyrhizobium lablabi TaxID=722472 RepID=UPI001BADD4E2|nr:acyl-CoA dehydrogenase family protein [Bradyrhizobium lablabi]MBR0693229.1 acyl-CoA/acyl-ACP dehydrogenase [Bradyrhizobium lablabi]